jgi:hypothetical protein
LKSEICRCLVSTFVISFLRCIYIFVVPAAYPAYFPKANKIYSQQNATYCEQILIAIFFRHTVGTVNANNSYYVVNFVFVCKVKLN